jgi:uncharacterized protein YbjT (DUF2867 family)
VILVVGATGMLGGVIVRRLLERGDQVRALVRDDTSERALIKAGAQTARGDLRDAASLASACDGISTLITTANSAGRGGEDNVDTVDLEGNRNLIEVCHHGRLCSTLAASASLSAGSRKRLSNPSARAARATSNARQCSRRR